MEEKKITLPPGGESLVGTMALKNVGEHEAELLVRGDGPVIRREMIIGPEDASTPALRVYYLVTVLYMVPSSFETLKNHFIDTTKEMVAALPQSRAVMAEIGARVVEQNYHEAHELCFQLIALEEQAANRDK